MRVAFVVVILLSVIARAAQAEDRGFRYRDGTCLDDRGYAGYNPSEPGPCGMLSLGGARHLGSAKKLPGAVMNGGRLVRARLDQADLRGSELIEAQLRGARVRGADLRVSVLSWADLKWVKAGGADFRGADLHGADLSHARLERADFRGADLSGVIARGDRHWTGARWDQFTILPESWGATEAARAAEARRRGMVRSDTSLDPNAIVQLVNGNPWHPCSRAGVFPTPGSHEEYELAARGMGAIPVIPAAEQHRERQSFDGTWMGEWEGIPGKLVIHGDRGRFESEDGGRLISVTLRRAESGSFGVGGSRALVEWSEGRWGKGRGFLLIDSDGDSLFGGVDFSDGLGFVRDEP